ncbi:MAG TPA: penicillin-binding transpeptidase domain-containing protein, partial [Aggregicoccus sp.]|nr:penicillin-binding transpeptidase domain-containing protein [Aggregicoccus sp.]
MILPSPSRPLLAALLLPLVCVLAAVGGSAPAQVAQVSGPDAGVTGGADAGAPDAGVAQAGMVPPRPVPDRRKAPPITGLRSLPARDDLLARARPDGKGHLVLPDGRRLTVKPALQDALTQLLRSYEVPFGAVVVLEPATGRVLAMAEHSHAQPGLRGLPTRAVFPAASVFKIVTGGALAEAGVSKDVEECFRGGKRRLTERMLEEGAPAGSCLSLAEAMGKSANVVFAKLALKHLAPEELRRMAAAFHFNRVIDFAVPTDVSLAAIPDDEFGFAEAGAGFGNVYLSPLHGALVASVAANGGIWKDPVLIEPATPAALPPALDPAQQRVLSAEAAAALTDMLEETVTSGTARGVFRERGFRVEGAVGKTGTLADRNPFRDYSWFVGFAPRDNPRVAVAALVVNDPRWRIRATYLGREALRLGLEQLPAPAPAVAASGSAGA